MNAVQIIYASTSGHTEYVARLLLAALGGSRSDRVVRCTRAEKADGRTLLDCDVLLLAAATWNTGGIEGQLNLHMAELLEHRAKDVDLSGTACACVALGDDRYFYSAQAADHLQSYVVEHHGHLAVPALKVINEPYGQEDAVRQWAAELQRGFVKPARGD